MTVGTYLRHPNAESLGYILEHIDSHEAFSCNVPKTIVQSIFRLIAKNQAKLIADGESRDDAKAIALSEAPTLDMIAGDLEEHKQLDALEWYGHSGYGVLDLLERRGDPGEYSLPTYAKRVATKHKLRQQAQDVDTVAEALYNNSLPDEIASDYVTNVMASAGEEKRKRSKKAKVAESTGPLTQEEIEKKYGKGLVLISQAVARPVKWLWEGRLLLENHNDVSGPPGIGKSTVFGADIPARISRGWDMPGGAPGLGEPAKSIILTNEDILETTVKPRLMAAGADCSMIYFLAFKNTWTEDEYGNITPLEQEFMLPRDFKFLEEVVRDTGAVYLFVDPLFGFVDTEKVNTSSDASVRTNIMAPFGKLAERCKLASASVRHFTKSATTDPLHKAGGSIAFGAFVRSGLIVAPDPHADPGSPRYVLASAKNNLGPKGKSITYYLESTTVREIDDGKEVVIATSKVEWGEESDLTATDIAAPPIPAADAAVTKMETSEAIVFLHRLLFDFEGHMRGKLAKAIADKAGISEKRLRTAREKICEDPTTPGFQAGWDWQLKPEWLSREPSAPPYTPEERATLGNIVI